MSTGTRAAASSISRKVKQRLVNILFRETYSKQGREAHRNLDFAAYSYTDLRKAYFERIQLLHPDKKSQIQSRGDDTKSKVSTDNHWRNVEESIKQRPRTVTDASTRSLLKHKNSNEEFIALKDAWEDYYALAKSMHKNKNKDSARRVDSDFTMFGVGCSFSDSPAERKLRSDIMDQACRGWLSAGQLQAGADSASASTRVDKSNDDRQQTMTEHVVSEHDVKRPIWSTDHNSDHKMGALEGDQTYTYDKSTMRQKSLVDKLVARQRLIRSRTVRS